jgi:hypothetical protein
VLKVGVTLAAMDQQKAALTGAQRDHEKSRGAANVAIGR